MTDDTSSQGIAKNAKCTAGLQSLARSTKPIYSQACRKLSKPSKIRPCIFGVALKTRTAL
jgi:hypothetical protein